METLFKVLAVILLGVAAVFFWQKNWDAVFASAVLSACAYFLSIRFQFKARVNRRKMEEEKADEDPPE
jgi:hypothetical protein